MCCAFNLHFSFLFPSKCACAYHIVYFCNPGVCHSLKLLAPDSVHYRLMPNISVTTVLIHMLHSMCFCLLMKHIAKCELHNLPENGHKFVYKVVLF